MDNNGFDNKNTGNDDVVQNNENLNNENQNDQIQSWDTESIDFHNYETGSLETPVNEEQGNEIKIAEDQYDITMDDSQTFHMDTIEFPAVEDTQVHQTQEDGTSLIVNNSDDSNGYDKQDTVRTSSFYTETLKKPRQNKNVGLFQLILVAVISSLMGGAFVAGFFQFVVPKVQPSAKGFFSSILPKDNTVKDNDGKEVVNVAQKVDTTQSGDSTVSDIAERVGPSIVGIRVTTKSNVQSFLFGYQQQESTPSEGSGIIIKSDGYIMTNYHVIESALNKSGQFSNNAKVEVILPNQKDKPYTAKLIGGDYKTDLAVIKIEASNLPAVEYGNSDLLKAGEIAIAIGNPAGLEYMGSVTVGVISGLNRTIPVEDGKDLKLIQTDAAINPGNSGGALLNSKGQVIGVNTAKIGATGYEGLGFAIPINTAKEITDSLMEYKYVRGRALLGIQADGSFNEEVARRYDVPMGVLVKAVTPFSGAYKAGIEAGDIITKFNGKEVKSVDEINTIKKDLKPGDTVNVEIYRDGERKTVKVQLTEDKGTN